MTGSFLIDILLMLISVALIVTLLTAWTDKL